jgi:hypothetical protein
MIIPLEIRAMPPRIPGVHRTGTKKNQPVDLFRVPAQIQHHCDDMRMFQLAGCS